MPILSRAFLVLPLGIALFGVGWATMEIPQDRAKGIESYPNRQTQNSVTIALQPVTDRDEVKKWFNTDLITKGVLPISGSTGWTNPEKIVKEAVEQLFLKSHEAMANSAEIKQAAAKR